MRKTIALVSLLVLCGCSGKTQQKKTAPPATRQGPPAIYLVVGATRHRLEPGSSCVESATGSVCGDAVYTPVKVLYPVRQGETVRLELDAQTRGADLTVGRPGCFRSEIAQVRLTPPKLEWRVELAPGQYEARVLIDHFQTDDGRSGDVSGQIGLRVGGHGGNAPQPVTAHPC